MTWRWLPVIGLLACQSSPDAEESKAAGQAGAHGPRGPKAKAAAAAKAEATVADPNRPIPEGKPNVLVIVWDTVRADHLSTWGYKRPTTPLLDAWSKQARVYERAVSPAMWTLPSHASLFTGLPESAHGADAEHHWLDKRFTTMAEAFVDAGWTTYLFASNPFLEPHTNLTQGFEVREYPKDPKWAKKSRKATMSKVDDADASNTMGPAYKPGRFPSGRSSDQKKDAAPVAGEALKAFIDARPDPKRPFFAVLNMMEAHVPRVPSEASRTALFSKEEIAKQLAFDQSYGELLAYTVKLREFTPEEIELIEQVYDASIRDLDAATGAILDGLSEAGLLENTIVVLTADHGEHLGDHHRADHKFSLYDALVRVPLVIRYPAAVPPGRETAPVSNLGVFATLAEVTGVKLPEGTLSQSLLRPPSDAAAYAELIEPNKMVFDRMKKVVPTFDTAPWELTYDAVVTPDLKCIVRSDGTRELYDVANDPQELKDLAAARPADAERLCSRISAWKGSFPAYDPSKAEQGEGPPPPSAAERQQLIDLGYMSEEEAKK